MHPLEINIFKFMHVSLAIAFFGMGVFSYCYTNASMLSTQKKLFANHLKIHRIIDTVMLGIGIVILSTGTLLVYPKHFTFHTPWIDAAYALFALSLLCYIIGMMIRKRNYHRLINNQGDTFVGKVLYHGCHVLMLACTVIIIHDAVTKTPLL